MKTLLTIMMVLLLAGCSSVQMRSYSKTEQVKKVLTPSGEVKVYKITEEKISTLEEL